MVSLHLFKKHSTNGLIVGLGPGGLDNWDPPYERDCYCTGVPL